MSELNSTQHAFDNAVNLLKDNNLNESIEQLHEILKVTPKHEDSIDLISDSVSYTHLTLPTTD